MSLNTRFISFAAFLFAFFLLAYLAWDVATPQAIVINDNVGEASVHFATQQDMVLLAKGCVEVEWQVEQIQALYLNNSGKTGQGQEALCFQVQRPSLRVVFVDDSEIVYTLPIRTFSNDPRTFLFVSIAFILIIFAAISSPITIIRQPMQIFLSRLHLHLKSKTITAEQIRRGRYIGYISSVLYGVFVLGLLSEVNMTLTYAIYILIGLLGVVLGLLPRIHRFFTLLMQFRWMVFSPIVWFIATITIQQSVPLTLGNYVAVQSWQTSIFFLLALHWLLEYVQRSFVFDPVRRFAWLSILGLFSIVMVISLTVPPLTTETLESSIVGRVRPHEIWYYYSSLAPDSIDYVKYTQAFPDSWRHMFPIIHRPTFFMLTSQVCHLVDVPLYGYTAPYRGCSNYDTAVVAIWITNFFLGLCSLLIIYELLLNFTGDARVSWLATMFAVISPFHIWTLALPSTDYVEFFIACLSLWLTYNLFRDRNIPPNKIVTYGLMFGLLLLIKMNATIYIFAVVMILFTRRWRLVWVWTVFPFGLLFIYTQLIPLWGIPYMTLETLGQWSTVRWLWLEWIYMTPQVMWRNAIIWFSHTAYQMAMLYGFLLLIAIFSSFHKSTQSRYWVIMAWLLFLSSALFAFVARVSYTSHVLLLMPVVYGMVALGIRQLQDYIHEKQIRWASLLSILIIAVPILLILVQWLAFGPHSSRSFVVLLGQS